MEIGYNANATIFEGTHQNKDCREYYRTNHPDVDINSRETIKYQDDLTDFLKERDTAAAVINEAESGLRYLVEQGSRVHIISSGKQSFVEHNVEYNSLEDAVTSVTHVAENETKSDACKNKGAEIYVSHSRKDLVRVDGAVDYFILMDQENAGKKEEPFKGTIVYNVEDLSVDSIKPVYEDIQNDRQTKE